MVIKKNSKLNFENIINHKRDIKEILQQIEYENSIKILYSCLTGSRIYDHAHNKSDFNIRFIYKKHLNNYLTLEKQPTQITYKEYEYECIGWDISKALTLHYKSNITLYEWLQSPIQYHKDEFIKFHTLIEFDKNKLLLTYEKLVEKLFKKKREIPYYLTMQDIKNYLYMIRYILSWNILFYEEQYPPLSIITLLQQNKLEQEILENISVFIYCYTNQLNKIGYIELANINAWIYNSLKIMKNTNPLHPPQRVNMDYHNLRFREIIKKRRKN